MEYIIIKRISRRTALTMLLLFSAVANSLLFTLFPTDGRLPVAFHSSLLHAQTDAGMRQIYTQAEDNYNIGRIEQARDSLILHLGSFRSQSRQNALRLIALTYLARFDTDQTEHYASLLLQENPYYSPSAQDPEPFVDIINKVKSGATISVTTASSIKETAVEAPAPVTIITAEMIENLGYNKRLGQILATYVPGMNEVYHNRTLNMSMHGAYGTTQELILVMENGHRLNNRMDNSYAMDYDISTDKIDHIEVLRGPASSLYGNVALSAVVNIITKSGSELDGVKVKYGHGAFHTHKADASIGTRFMDANIFVWGSFYQSDGQHRPARDAAEYKDKFNEPMPNGYYSYVDGYRDTPTYDLGMTIQYKGFELMMSRKNIKKLTQYGEYGYYDYDKYRSINGIRPGWLTQTDYLQLSYTRQTGPATLKASVYGDWHNAENFVALSSEDTTKYSASKGVFVYGKSTDRTLGGSIQASAGYKAGSMNGNLLAGVQFEHFSVADYSNAAGEDYTGDLQSGIGYDYLSGLKHENSWSFYAQCKHYFMPKLIFNAGLRYDLRYRFIHDTARKLSPRLALICTPREAFNVKLSYSEAYVDKSYEQRIQERDNPIAAEPQYLTAVQLTFMGRLAPFRLAYDFNLFYNKYDNLLSFSDMFERNSTTNIGVYKCVGLEASLAYSHRRLAASACLYWQRVVKADNYHYSENDNAVLAVPKMSANLNIAYRLLDNGKHELKIYGNAKYTGCKTLSKTDYSGIRMDLEKPQYYNLNSTFAVDAGIKYTFNQRLSLSADCENLTDTDRFLSRAALIMYPYYERGRNLMIAASYRF